jgi:hypothetical protein
MDPKFEHNAVEWLADFAEHWAEAPLLDLPAIRAAVDQWEAGQAQNLNESGMTEGERIAFGLGFMLCATRLHEQIEVAGMHDDQDVASVCEATGMFAGSVAAKALDPIKGGGD